MPDFDWHAERTDLSGIALMDAPAPANVDVGAMRAWRLGRVRAQMTAHQMAACILSDPISIRYASGAVAARPAGPKAMPVRWLLVTTDQCILFDQDVSGAGEQSLDPLTQIRPVPSAGFGHASQAIPAREASWAAHMADVLTEYVGPGVTVGMERATAGSAAALSRHGFHTIDARDALEMARSIKSSEEMACVNASLRATEHAVSELRTGLRPGLTEAQLWSVLHQAVLDQHAGHVETRLLSPAPPPSGDMAPRPLPQNALVALDTDLIGCEGYYCDFSRTFHTGPDAPSAAQRTLYKVACD